MKRTSLFLRLALVAMVLFAMAPGQFAYAADPNAPYIAEGLRSFGRAFTGLDDVGAIALPLPLSALRSGGADGLRLNDIFRESLSDRLTGSYDSLDALKTAIEQLNASYSGVQLTFENVSVRQNGTQIDVGFGVRAHRTVSTALVVDQPSVQLKGGAITVDLDLTTTLSFQLNLVDRQPGRDFYLIGAPTMQVRAHAGGSIGSFEDQLGFAGVNVAGTVNIDVGLVVALLDPDRNGRITQEEWVTTALADLARADFTVGAADAVNASLTLNATPIPGATSELIPGSPDATITLADHDLRDGVSAPVVALRQLEGFTAITPSDVLDGLNELAGSLLATQANGDPKLPFLDRHLLGNTAFAEPLLSFLHQQADAAILCGTANTDPPAGDLRDLKPGQSFFCQAVALLAASEVTWSSTAGRPGANTSGPTALATVGPNPSANAVFEATAAGIPRVTVAFTDLSPSSSSSKDNSADGRHTVTTLFRTAQGLFELLRDLGGFELDPPDIAYDPATSALTYHLQKTIDVSPASVGLAFGDQFSDATGLRGLTPTGGAGATIDLEAVRLDLTFGMTLAGRNSDYAGGVEDRFFVRNGGGPGAYMFTADANVDAAIEMAGQIGFVGVNIVGDAAANPVRGDSKAFLIGRSNPNRPMLGVSLAPPAGGIPVPGRAPLPNAVRVAQLLHSPAQYTRADVNIRMSGGLRVTASASGAQLASGMIGIAWPNITNGTPTITPDASFLDQLKSFDIDPNNPAALLSVILNSLDALASGMQATNDTVFNKNLPLIATSPKDLLPQFRTLQATLDELRANPPVSLQDLEQRLKQALGPDATLSFALGQPAASAIAAASGSPRRLIVRLGYRNSDSRTIPLNLSLGDLPSIVALDQDASFRVAYDGTLQLDLGIPLSPTVKPTDLRDVAVLGTSGITLGATVAADGIKLNGSVGPFELAIGTSVDTNGDDTPDGVGVARLNAQFTLRNTAGDQPIESFVKNLRGTLGGSDNGDCGQVLDLNSQPVALRGVACARLSLGLSVPGASSYLGDLGFRMSGFNAQPEVVLPPNFREKLSNLATEMDWDLLLKALPQLVSGLAKGLENGKSLPLIGKSLDAGAKIADTINDKLVNELSDLPGLIKAKPTAGEVENVIRSRLAEVLGTLLLPPGAVRARGIAPQADSSAISVVTMCGATRCDPNQGRAAITDVRVSFRVGAENIHPLDFDIGVPGLPLSAEGKLQSVVGWHLDVGFGLSRDSGPYLLGGPQHGLSAEAAITVAEAPQTAACRTDDLRLPPDTGETPEGLRGFSPLRCLNGKLGFLGITLYDGNTPDAQPDKNDPTRAFAKTSVQLGDDEVLPLGQLTSGAVAIKQSLLDAGANVDLRFRTGVASQGSGRFPSIVGTFNLEWSTTRQPGGPDQAMFNSLHLDVGSFAHDLLEPVIGDVKHIIRPIRRVIDALYEPLPGVSQASRLVTGQDITLASLLPSNANLEMPGRVLKLISLADSLSETGLVPIPPTLASANVQGASPASDNLVPLGSFGVNLSLTMSGPLTPDQVGTLIVNPNWNNHVLNGIRWATSAPGVARAGQAGGAATAATGLPFDLPEWIRFPFLQDKNQIFALLLGQDVTLVHVDAGTASATAAISQKFGPIPVGFIPVSVRFSGSATLAGRFAMGYDTRGMRSSGELLHGLFFDDRDASGADVPEISLTGSIAVGASVDAIVLEVGIEGGIELTAGLNLHDPDNDGRVYYTEVADRLSNPICLFDATGRLGAFLSAFVRIGVEVWGVTIGKTFRKRIADETLLDYTKDLCANAPRPILAHVEGNNLILHIGDLARLRNVETKEKNETFVVRQMSKEGDVTTGDGRPGTRFSITAFNITQEYILPLQGTIIGNAADGNDSISLEPGTDAQIAGTLRPGEDNQRAIVRPTVPAHFDGGSGDDRLKGGDGPDQLIGGSENDTINGGDGIDTIRGGEGDDTLNGENGADDINGENGDDTISGGPDADKIDGGAGNDQIEGGTGTEKFPDLRDEIAGGPGSDTITGGDGADQIYGDEVLAGTDSQQCDADGKTTASNDDQIFGGPDNDTIYGGAGNDTILGEAGDDHICGNGGDDRLDGDDMNPDAPDGNDTIYGGTGNDMLSGRGGDDDLFGRTGDDVLSGEEGNDDLSGGMGSDRLEGAAGRDYLFGDDGSAVRPAGQPNATSVSFSETLGDPDHLFGGDGDDVLYGEGGADEINGDAGQDTLYGNGGGDLMRGGAENDTMQGNTDGDEMYGDSGDDRMFGNDGADTMRGGIGDDYVEGNQSNDTIFGDADQDDLIGGSAAGGAADLDDAMDGGMQQDYMAGDNAQITRPGGVTSFDGAAIRVVVLLDIDSPDQSVAGGDHMFGGDGNDRMWGQGGGDLMHGGADDDFMQGNAASDDMYGDVGQDDIIGGSDAPGRLDSDDTLRGGDGQGQLTGDFDVIVGDNARIVRPLSFGRWQINAFNGSVRRSTILLDEQLLGRPPVSSTVSGDDRIFGESGDDLLYGQGGADLLRGGGGDDSMEGDSGTDLLYGDAGQDDMVGGSGAPGRLDGDDTLHGGDGESDPADASDVIAGDNAVIGRPLTCGLWQTNLTNRSVVRNVTLFEMSVVGGSSTIGGDDTLAGESGDDTLYGQDGDDTILGGPGEDYLEGNAGRDNLLGEMGNDDMVGGTGRVNADGPAGINGRLDGGDMLSGGSGFDVIAGDNAIITRAQVGKPPAASCQTLVGGRWRQNSFNAGIQHNPRILLDVDSHDVQAVSGDDIILGDDDDDLLYGQGGYDDLSGGTGDDTIEGNAGSDTIAGGDGNDDITGGSTQSGTFDDTPDLIHGDAGGDVIAGDNANITRPLDRHGQWKRDTTTGAALRDVRLYDVLLKGKRMDPRLSSSDTIDGGAGYDMVLGQGGDDILSGGDDPDYMEGNAGADIMSGGAGRDRMIGGSSGADGVVGSGKKLKDLVDSDDTIDGGGDGDIIIQGNGVIR